MDEDERTESGNAYYHIRKTDTIPFPPNVTRYVSVLIIHHM